MYSSASLESRELYDQPLYRKSDLVGWPIRPFATPDILHRTVVKTQKHTRCAKYGPDTVQVPLPPVYNSE